MPSPTTLFVCFAAFASFVFYLSLPRFSSPSFRSLHVETLGHFNVSSVEPTTTITSTAHITKTITVHRQVTATRSRRDVAGAATSDAMPGTSSSDLVQPGSAEKTPIPVGMYIMSKCPDAAYCVHNLVLPLMSNI